MILFYIPCPDMDSARNIAKTLLEEKIIACANIIPAMESLYWWDNKIESSSEVILILKALKIPETQDRVTARAEQLHPYRTPCVITLPVLGVNSSYQKWLEEI